MTTAKKIVEKSLAQDTASSRKLINLVDVEENKMGNTIKGFNKSKRR